MEYREYNNTLDDNKSYTSLTYIFVAIAVTIIICLLPWLIQNHIYLENKINHNIVLLNSIHQILPHPRTLLTPSHFNKNILDLIFCTLLLYFVEDMCKDLFSLKKLTYIYLIASLIAAFINISFVKLEWRVQKNFNFKSAASMATLMQGVTQASPLNRIPIYLIYDFKLGYVTLGIVLIIILLFTYHYEATLATSIVAAADGFAIIYLWQNKGWDLTWPMEYDSNN